MRKSLARKITIPFFLAFTVLAFVLATVGYYFLYKNVTKQVKTNLQANALNLKRRIESKVTDDMEYADFVKDFKVQAKGVCEDFDIDFISLYEPMTDTEALYYAVAQREGTRLDTSVIKSENLAYYVMDEAELRVWNNETEVDFLHWNGSYEEELCVVVKIYGPDNREVLMSVEKSYDYIRETVLKTLILTAALILGVFLTMSLVLYFVIKKRVSKPAREISSAMEKFVVDGKRNETKLQEYQNDEFGVISQSFNKMADDIDAYVKNISELNHERNRQQTEIDIASKIQKGFLPPQSTSTDMMEIRSVMKPAKDIGGDMYDYIRLDEDHYYAMIADVSGKGISASLYMASVLTYMRQLVKNNPDPAYVLKTANNYLAANNPEMVFVTAFVCIYDVKNGMLTYSNAGHNPPYVLTNEVVKLDQAVGTVIGIFEDEEYENATIPIRVGDTLLLYTDGVTEALNEKREFYGEEKLEKVLANIQDNELLPMILKDITTFVGKQEQSDDLTMLMIHLKEGRSLVLHGTEPEFVQIRDRIMRLDLDEETKLQLCLAAEEVYVNICNYAFDEETERKVSFTLDVSGDIVMKFRDNGKKYNPLEDVKDADDLDEYDPEEDEGGLGKFIAFNIMDGMKYEYENNENVLTLTKSRRTES